MSVSVSSPMPVFSVVVQYSVSSVSASVTASALPTSPKSSGDSAVEAESRLSTSGTSIASENDKKLKRLGSVFPPLEL